MATILNSSILNSAILDSAILHKTLTQTSSIWLKLIHSGSTWWYQPSWILPSWIQLFCSKKNFTHSDSTWWWQPSWILPYWIQTLPSWIQTPWYLLSDSLKNTLTPFWLWLKLIQSDSNSFILTQIDDCSHLEFCHHGFIHFAPKKTSLIHSDSTWWWQPSWILPCWIQTLPSWIQTPCYLLSDTLKNTLPPLWLCLKLIPSD